MVRRVKLISCLLLSLLIDNLKRWIKMKSSNPIDYDPDTIPCIIIAI